MTFLIISPLFISIFFLSFSFLLVLKRHNQAYFICYKTGANIQNTLREHLQKLTSMNTQARILRIKRKIAELRYHSALASLDPVNILQARKRLQKVKFEQQSFSNKQERILKQAQISFQTQWKTFKLKSKKYIYNVKKTFHLQPLAVRKKPAESDSPGYVPVEGFSEKQKIKISWRMNGFALIPQKLQEHLGLKGISDHHCSVSLEDLTGGFQMKLMK
ncbi:MAG: hypothetical protein OXK80_01525 [Bdellovibrionales bacterium]|nr:hypothetical protein [Bdellovibrionales bacterium]